MADRQLRLDLVALVPRLRRVAAAITGSLEAGDELVQATCVRVLERSDQFRPGTRFDSWVFRILRNIWLDEKRREAVRGVRVDPELVALSDGGVGARRPEDRMMMRRVGAEVQALPPEQRLVLTLVAIDGWSYRETAEMLDIPIGTVMSRLSRARARLLPLV